MGGEAAECGTIEVQCGWEYLRTTEFSGVYKSAKKKKKMITGLSYWEVTGDLGDTISAEHRGKVRHHKLSHE